MVNVILLALILLNDQTRQQISAVSRPKFTILSRHVEEVLLFNRFFPILDTCLSSEDIA